MDAKLFYISRLFTKISSKGLETYVITRLWHLLNDNEIKIIPQQYVLHSDFEYALTDLYFPQIKLHLEINEPAHYISSDRINRDQIRSEKIIAALGHTLQVIDCSQDIEKIHRDIDDVILIIREKISEVKKANQFYPWNPEKEHKAAYYIKLGYLDAKEEPEIDTIEEICALFNVKVPKRGFLRKGAADHKTLLNTVIWWPSAYNKDWENSISPDGAIIIERAKNHDVRAIHTRGIINNLHTRITFFKSRDILGYNYYRFVGIYELDVTKTSTQDGLYWRRINEYLKLG